MVAPRSAWAVALHVVLAIHADAVLFRRQLPVAAPTRPVKLDEDTLARHMLEELELFHGRENQSWADQSATQDDVTAFCTLAFAATAAKEGLPWQYMQFKPQFTSLAKAELKWELYRHSRSSSSSAVAWWQAPEEEKDVRLRLLANRLGRAFVDAVQGDIKRVAKRRALEVRGPPSFGTSPRTLAFMRQRSRPRSAGPVDAFIIRTGSCQRDERGCILSPGYPGNYANRQSCVIGLNSSSPSGPIIQESFDTERSYDVLIVNGVKYSGANGPDSVVPSSDMLWYTDYNNTGNGWKLCPGGQEEVGMAPAQTAPARPFSVLAGDCAVDAEGCATSPSYPDDYPADSGCTIAVNENVAAPLVVTNFSTEFAFDSLNVNSQSFSGLDGPHGLTPRGNITWATDTTTSSSGWRICSSASSHHAANGTASFRVRTGPCVVDEEGCATSPGFFREGKQRYRNAELCILEVNESEARPLKVAMFNTEVGYDNLIVNGVRYNGARGPDGVVPFEDIVWLADDSTVSSGWRICLGSDLNGAAPDTDDGTGGVADVFSVREGNCTTTDSPGCISSPNFPREYGPQESCIIDVTNNHLIPLRVDEFSTEQDADVLTIDAQAFSGVTGPDGVVPTGRITWSSDTNISAPGWKLCLVPQPLSESQPQEGPAPPDNPHDEWSVLGELKRAMLVVSSAWRDAEAEAGAFEEAGQGFKEDLMAALDNKSSPFEATVRSVEAIVRSGLPAVLGNWTSVAQQVGSALNACQQEMLTVDPSGLVVPLLKWTEGTELRAIDTYVRWLRGHTFWVHAIQVDWALVTATQVQWLQESADSLLEHMDNFQEHLYSLMEEAVGSMRRRLISMEERVLNQAVQQSLQLLNVTALGCAASLDVMDKAASQASGHTIKDVVQSVVEFLCNERKEAAVEAVVPIEKEMLLITIGEAIEQGQEALADVTATAWQLHRAARAVHSAIFSIEPSLHSHLRQLSAPRGL